MSKKVLTKDELQRLVMYSVGKKDPSMATLFEDKEISEETVNTVLRDQFQKLAGTRDDFLDNERMIFRLMQDAIDEVLPKRVFDSIKIFAEFRTVKDGEKVTFKQPRGRIRGRNFITRVAHAGSYEVFQMDRKVWDMPVTAYGGAVKIQFEEMLEGRIDFPELIQSVTEGYEEAIYREILLQLLSLTQETILPKANVKKANGFAPVGFGNLISITRAYGVPTIFCSEMFATQILPPQHMLTDGQKEAHASQGYLGSYQNANIVVLPYSFYDTSNEAAALTLPAGLAWILPSGPKVDDKPVKVVFEGDTQLKHTDTADWGKKIDAYKKLGIMLFSNPGMTVYHNTALDKWPDIQGPIINMPNGEVADVKYIRTV